MNKCESVSLDVFKEICQSSQSLREIAIKLGYSPNSESANKVIKKLMAKHKIDSTHLKGQAHSKKQR